MRIVQALGWYYPENLGGTETYASGLSKRLVAMGHDLLIAAPQAGLAAPRILSAEAPHYWAATDSITLAVQNQFAARGAKAMVANLVPEGGPGPDWIPFGNTCYFAIMIPPVISGGPP